MKDHRFREIRAEIVLDTVQLSKGGEVVEELEALLSH